MDLTEFQAFTDQRFPSTGGSLTRTQNIMPTLIDVRVGRRLEEASDDDEGDEATESILYDQSMTLLDDSISLGLTPSSSTLPRSKLHKTAELRGYNSPTTGPSNRRGSLDGSANNLSDVAKTVDTNGKFKVNEEERSRVGPLTQSDTHLERQPAKDQVGIRKPLQTITGPNETYYRSRYDTFVSTTIRKFDDRNPGRLRNYRSLSTNEQASEQERVLALLARLGIGKYNRHPQDEEVTLRHQAMNRERRQLNETISPLLSPTCHAPPHLDDDVTASFTFPNQGSPLESPNLDRFGCLSTSPVEIARAASDTSLDDDSPRALKAASSYKRLASSSAKKGADLSRMRYNDDFVMPGLPKDYSDDDAGELSDQLSSKLGRLSISPQGGLVRSPGDDVVFPASQSPISPKLTYASSDGETDDDNDHFTFLKGRHRQDATSVPTTDTICTWSTRNVPDRSHRHDRPAHVGMKEGAAFHLEKLHVQRSQLVRSEDGIGGTIRRLVGFPDPFVRYSSKHKMMLKRVFESLVRSEKVGKLQTWVETSSSNLLFSLTPEQITDLCLKLLLEDEAQNDRWRRRRPTNPSFMQGETVIVARSKEDLTAWEGALREGTGCSVFNLAAAPLSERVRLRTAEKVIKFDVVLTTFDALKSTDIAIPIEDNGRAIVGASNCKDESEWIATRGGSLKDEARPQKCMQLSVLHKVNFRRVIFVDVLGRKSFLAKFGTARARAATALRANSRIVFFSRSEADGNSAFRVLKKSDNRAEESLSVILHLQPHNDDDRGDSDDSDDNQANVGGVDPLAACALDVEGLL